MSVLVICLLAECHLQGKPRKVIV